MLALYKICDKKATLKVLVSFESILTETIRVRISDLCLPKQDIFMLLKGIGWDRINHNNNNTDHTVKQISLVY